MKSRGLTISAALLAVLAGLLWWSNKEKAKEADKPAADAPPKILTLTGTDIQKLELKRGGDSIVVQKNNSGKWEIVQPKTYGADQETMAMLVGSAAAVNSDRLVDDKPTDLKQYGLDTPSLEVDISLKGGATKKVLFGDDAPGGNSTYTMLQGDPKVYTTASFTKGGLNKTVNDLRDKRLLTFDQDKISRVEITAKKDTVEFGRSKDEWQILKPAPMRADGLQVEELVRKLKDAKMDLTATDDAMKTAATSFASGTPVATVKVTDASGTQELQVRKKGDDYFAKSSAAEGFHKVPADLGTGVDKSLSDFRNKKLFDFGFSEPEKIDLHDNGKSYAFQKSGEKWLSNGKEMDNTSVQSLLDKLRDFSAAKFVDTGFTTPVIDVTVTSGSGKRVEKVLIVKAGDKYIAKRDNEPSLYEMEAKTVDEMTKSASDVKPAPPAKKK